MCNSLRPRVRRVCEQLQPCLPQVEPASACMAWWLHPRTLCVTQPMHGQSASLCLCARSSVLVDCASERAFRPAYAVCAQCAHMCTHRARPRFSRVPEHRSNILLIAIDQANLPVSEFRRFLHGSAPSQPGTRLHTCERCIVFPTFTHDAILW